MHHRQHRGFMLMEVLIVIAMVAILLAVAVPFFPTHLRQARYLSMVTATTPFKVGVEECFALIGSLSECSSGRNGVPLDIYRPPGHGIVHTVTTAANGVITATPYPTGGILASDYYQLTPIIVGNEIEWQPGGPGLLKGYAH